MVPTGRRTGGLGRPAGVRLGVAGAAPGPAGVRLGPAALSGRAERPGPVPVIAQAAVSAPAASSATALSASDRTGERRAPDRCRWRLRRAGEPGWSLRVTPAG